LRGGYIQVTRFNIRIFIHCISDTESHTPRMKVMHECIKSKFYNILTSLISSICTNCTNPAAYLWYSRQKKSHIAISVNRHSWLRGCKEAATPSPWAAMMAKGVAEGDDEGETDGEVEGESAGEAEVEADVETEAEAEAEAKAEDEAEGEAEAEGEVETDIDPRHCAWPLCDSSSRNACLNRST
jgi:hypothetical protein